MLELQHLHEKLDVDDAARAAFQVAAGGRFFQAVPHVADSCGVVAAASGVEGGPAHDGHGRGRRAGGAVNDAGLAQRLPLPKLSAALGEVAAELGQRGGQRPLLPVGRSRASTSYSRP